MPRVGARVADALAVFLHFDRTPSARPLLITGIPAFARVHGGDEHEVGGEGHGAGGAGDGDPGVFQGLAQDFEGLAAELGEFVEEKDAVVGDADFAGRRVHAAADQADVGDGVVRRAEGADGDEWAVGVKKQAADAVDLGRFDGFLEVHRRNDRGDALGDHRFAGAGRADE